MATPQRPTLSLHRDFTYTPTDHTIVQNQLFTHNTNENYEPSPDHRRKTLQHPILDADGYVASSNIDVDIANFDQTSSRTRDANYLYAEPVPVIKQQPVGPKTCGSVCLQVSFASVVVVIAIIALVLASIANGNAHTATATLSPRLQQNDSVLHALFEAHEIIVQQQAESIQSLVTTTKEQSLLIQLLNDTNNEHAIQIKRINDTNNELETRMQRINEQLEQILANPPTTGATIVTPTSLPTASPSPMPSSAPSFSPTLVPTSVLMSTTMLTTSAADMALEQVVADLVKNVAALLALSELNKKKNGCFGEQMDNPVIYGGIGDAYVLNSDAFALVKNITGSFLIHINNNLIDITGFTNVTTVDSFDISGNANLIDISGFTSLTTVRSYFQIYSNAALTKISGFTNLTTIHGYLRFLNNPKLTNFDSLRNLQCIRGGIYDNNPSKECLNCPQWLIDIATLTKGKC